MEKGSRINSNTNRQVRKSFNLKDFVRFCVDSYLEQNKIASQSEMSRKCRIPKTTLNRMYNTKQFVSFDTCLKLISVLTNKKEAIAKLNELNVDYGKKVYQHFQANVQNENDFKSNLDDLEGEDFIVSILSFLDNGTTQTEIYNVLGAKGLMVLNDLICNGVVIKQEDRFIFSQGHGQYNFKTEKINKKIQALVEHYKIAHLGHNRNYIHLGIKRLNKTGIKKLQDAHKVLHETLIDIHNNEKCFGDIPVFSVSVLDSLTTDQEIIMSQFNESQS